MPRVAKTLTFWLKQPYSFDFTAQECVIGELMRCYPSINVTGGFSPVENKKDRSDLACSFEVHDYDELIETFRKQHNSISWYEKSVFLIQIT